MKIQDQIDKLVQVAADIKQLLAVHDEKIDQHERKQDDIFSLIEQRRQEMSEDIKELHSRITSTEQRILSGIDDLKVELKADQQYHNQKQKSLEDRITDLEKWRYILLGAGIAGGWLLTKFGNMFEIIVK